MTSGLQAALQSALALATYEEQLIRGAWELYHMGFTPQRISASQMAAVGEVIRSAANLEKAKSTVATFLDEQIKKLRSKAERSGRSTSWLLAPHTVASAETLGQTFITWVREERYLPQEGVPPTLDRLAALQRFWSRFYDLYRYAMTMGTDMTLAHLTSTQQEGRGV